MPLRDIIVWPDPRLKRVAEPVTVFDAKLQALIDDMVETMYAEQGIGLAAPQVGINQRLFVVDADPEDSEARPRLLINPELVEAEGEILFDEGCLSVPGETIEVPRSTRVRMRAQDRDGHFFEIEAEGVLAIALQHELDHLDGKLIVDELSSIKREMLKKRMVSLKEERTD